MQIDTGVELDVNLQAEPEFTNVDIHIYAN